MIDSTCEEGIWHRNQRYSRHDSPAAIQQVTYIVVGTVLYITFGTVLYIVVGTVLYIVA